MEKNIEVRKAVKVNKETIERLAACRKAGQPCAVVVTFESGSTTILAGCFDEEDAQAIAKLMNDGFQKEKAEVKRRIGLEPTFAVVKTSDFQLGENADAELADLLPDGPEAHNFRVRKEIEKEIQTDEGKQS